MNGLNTIVRLNSVEQDFVDHILTTPYKDVNLLRRFMSDRAKIRARRVSGNDSQQQKEIARAIKNAREMALLPYTNRVTTQRSSRPDRGGRGEGRPPRGEEAELAPVADDLADVPQNEEGEE